MPRVIHIAKSGAKAAPTLPEDAVTRTFGIFGTKDSGKTNTGRVLVEGICKTGGHAIVFDPVGVWWGATRAGEGPGIPGVVIGGEHGDVPLEETGGRLIAELALSRQYALIVVDMQMLRKGAMRRFLADCLEELYHRNRLPLSVVFEEADQVLPQNPRGMDPILGRVLGAAEDIVKLGRSRGLGGALISQRLATVNKNVTEQIENLILLRLVGPNDLKAVKEWVQSNGDPTVTQRVLDTIAHMEQGEGWMYSPGWLKLLERVRVRHARTLDTSATPTNEQAVVEESAKRAPISLDDLRSQMAESIERAKENDPKELRKRIAELEEKLEAAGEAEPVSGEPERVEFIVPDRELVGELTELTATLSAGAEELVGARSRIEQAGGDFTAAVASGLEALGVQSERVKELFANVHPYLDYVGRLPAEGVSRRGLQEQDRMEADQAAARAHAQRKRREPPAQRKVGAPDGVGLLSIDKEISAGAERLYGELTQLAPLRLSRTQLATILRRGVKSSTLTQQLAELKAAGLVEEARGSYGVANADGVPEMSRAALVERWRSALPEGPRSLLECLLTDSPLAKDDLFARAGFSPTSSTPVTHLKLLRDNDLAEAENGLVHLGPAVAV